MKLINLNDFHGLRGLMDHTSRASQLWTVFNLGWIDRDIRRKLGLSGLADHELRSSGVLRSTDDLHLHRPVLSH